MGGLWPQASSRDDRFLALRIPREELAIGPPIIAEMVRTLLVLEGDSQAIVPIQTHIVEIELTPKRRSRLEIAKLSPKLSRQLLSRAFRLFSEDEERPRTKW
jgi:hypothetical protein